MLDQQEHDLEALIRAAGDYVRPSDDLRPQVLEEARICRAERQAQVWIWQLVLTIAVCLVLISEWRLQVIRELQVQDPAPALSQHPDNPSWQSADRFSAMRQRQASLFRWPF